MTAAVGQEWKYEPRGRTKSLVRNTVTGRHYGINCHTVTVSPKFWDELFIFHVDELFIHFWIWTGTIVTRTKCSTVELSAGQTTWIRL
jgi:hypothetical protein